jgi:hypothetical protein
MTITGSTDVTLCSTELGCMPINVRRFFNCRREAKNAMRGAREQLPHT